MGVALPSKGMLLSSENPAPLKHPAARVQLTNISGTGRGQTPKATDVIPSVQRSREAALWGQMTDRWLPTEGLATKEYKGTWRGGGGMPAL